MNVPCKYCNRLFDTRIRHYKIITFDAEYPGKIGSYWFCSAGCIADAVRENQI